METELSAVRSGKRNPSRAPYGSGVWRHSFMSVYEN